MQKYSNRQRFFRSTPANFAAVGKMTVAGNITYVAKPESGRKSKKWPGFKVYSRKSYTYMEAFAPPQKLGFCNIVNAVFSLDRIYPPDSNLSEE